MSDIYSITQQVGLVALWVPREHIKAVFGISPRKVEDAYRNGAPIERRYVDSKPVYSALSINSWIDSLPQDR